MSRFLLVLMIAATVCIPYILTNVLDMLTVATIYPLSML